ncbi:MAG: hypothetical protein OEQ53_16925, partial [Saprospiraceae bacterium]|nr:hypothetical protein [Saprospiraceae bacterium]
IKIGTICKDPDGLTDGSLASAVSIKEINDDNWVIAGDVNSQNQLWQHNFTYTLDQNALPSSTVNRFQTWADVRASILQNSVTGPAILPLIVKFEAGNYDREPIIFRDSWAPSANLRIAPGVRIEELQTENDMDANILPRIGLTYEPGGILKVSQFKSNGNLCIDVPIQIQRFILNAAEQNLKLSANNSFSAEVFDVASSLTLSGQVITDQIVLSGQVIAEDLLSGIILTNSDPDLFANGFNSPVEGSPAFTEGEFAHVNGLFERRTDAFNVWNAPQDNEGYFFPLRDPLIIQPTGQTVSGAAVDVSTQVIESIEANLQMPIEYQEGNLADFEIVSPRVYRIGVRLRFNRRTPLTDPLEANVRVPAASLGEVADPNLYRLLIFDCDGNLVGPAGTFIPSAEEAQTALLYTGSIDGVYNISHSGVLLDSCQYLAIAKGEMTTAVIEPDGLKQGFALHANHPNPFREITHIEYTLPCTSLVHLNVFNLLGQKVSTLVNAIQPDGDYSISWNARSDSGATVDAGAYYYQIEFTDPTRSSYRFVQNKKMILIR